MNCVNKIYNLLCIPIFYVHEYICHTLLECGWIRVEILVRYNHFKNDRDYMKLSIMRQNEKKNVLIIVAQIKLILLQEIIVVIRNFIKNNLTKNLHD